MSHGHALAVPETASPRVARPPSLSPQTARTVGPNPSDWHSGRELDRLTLQRAFAGVGQPVDAVRRANVERVTGQDLSPVRLHTGAAVRVAALAAGASAFTVGDHVAIAVGPDQAIPERLLTHELVHAAQQRAPGDATPARAEQQAREMDVHIGADGLAGTGGSYLAFAAEDWLHSSPDIRSYGYSALLDEINEIDEWLERQISSSPEEDRMREARAAIEAEITRRQGAMPEQDRPRRRRRRGKGAAGHTEGSARQTQGGLAPTQPEAGADSAQTEMPRILREQTSTQLTDPDEIRTEIDRITAWLERPDLGWEVRSILRQELAALAPGLETDLARASGQRRQARLARALDSGVASGRPGVLANLRMIEAIRPYTEQPGMAYLLHEDELLVFPQEVADRVRAETTAALRDAAARARSMNDSTEFRMDAHLRLNYEDQPVVGFVVSVISREEPVELQGRMLGPLSDSQVALSVFDRAAARGSLSAMGDAVFTAVEKAEEASTIVREGVDKAIAAAGTAVTGLTITRDLAFTVSLSIGAIVAAPVVASGVAGLGATGLTATGLTAVGTSGVVGTGGFALGFVGGSGGELAAGHGVDRALSAGWSEGKRVGAEGAVSGLGGGATLGLAKNLGLGAQGLSRSQRVWRGALAQGGGGGIGGAAGGYLSAPEGERGRAMLLGGLSGFGFGALGGASGAWAEGLGSPALRYGAGVGIPAVGDTGVTYLQTGDWGQAIRAGGLGLTTGALGQRRAARGTTSGTQAPGTRPPGTQAPGTQAPGTQGPAVRVSRGAFRARPDQQVIDPFSGEVLGQRSASARTSRSVITGPRADEGEAAAWRVALSNGEIGLQAPSGANIRGGDFFTARIDPSGQVTLIATDVKLSTIGQFPRPATTLKASWRAELSDAIQPGRLDLGDPALEASIRSAFAAGRIQLRQINADYSPAGGGTITGF